jgi:hypothetical protein
MAVTAEKGKKAKAPAKPRATVAKSATPKAAAKVKSAAKPTVAEKVIATTVTFEEIAHLARKYWADRGHHDGHAEQDWLRAEHELRQKAS